MESVSFSLFKSEETVNLPFLCESFDKNLFRPTETKSWYESLFAVREGKTVNLYVPESSPSSVLCLWLGIAKDHQNDSFHFNDSTGDIILWFFDTELGSYREQIFCTEPDLDLEGSARNPLIPKEFV